MSTFAFCLLLPTRNFVLSKAEQFSRRSPGRFPNRRRRSRCQRVFNLSQPGGCIESSRKCFGVGMGYDQRPDSAFQREQLRAQVHFVIRHYDPARS